MAVYIDQMRDFKKRIGRAGPAWCHMLADSNAELHAMAAAIGLRRSWFQGDHYDIGSERIRALAVAHGAVQLEGREWMRTVSELRRARRATAYGTPTHKSR